MALESSLPRSKQPANRHCPEPNEYSPLHCILQIYPTAVLPSTPIYSLPNQYCMHPSLHMRATCPTQSVPLYLISRFPSGCATVTASTNETKSAVSVFEQSSEDGS
jgi:hypothetical protein